jgi:hypothetical protein
MNNSARRKDSTMNRQAALILASAVVLGACSGEGTEANPSQATGQEVSTGSPPTTPAESPAETVPANPAGAPGDDVPELVGTWDYRFGRADADRLVAEFADLVDEDVERVVGRVGFAPGNEWWQGFLFDGELILVDGVPEGDGGTYAVHGDELTTTGAHESVLVTYIWSMDGDRLTLTAVEECTIDSGAKTGCENDRSQMEPMMRLVTENTFTRSGYEATH